MEVEIRVAVGLIFQLIKASKLCSEEQDRLYAALTAAIKQRCTAVWIPTSPDRGSACRSITVFSQQIDPLLVGAFAAAELEHLVAAVWPLDTVIWVDPGNVSWRLGSDRSPITVVYDARQEERKGKDGLLISNVHKYPEPAGRSPPLDRYQFADNPGTTNKQGDSPKSFVYGSEVQARTGSGNTLVAKSPARPFTTETILTRPQNSCGARVPSEQSSDSILQTSELTLSTLAKSEGSKAISAQ